MAARKQQNRVNSDKTKQSSNRRTSVKTGSQRAQGKKSTGRARQNQQPEPDGMIRAEVIILGSFALAVLLFLSNFHLCGFAGDLLRGLQLGLFGTPGYVAPVALFVGTSFYQANRGNWVAERKMIACAATFLLLCGFSQMVFGQQPESGKGILEYYHLSAASGLGGGLVGGLIFGVVRSILGGVGAFLIMVVGLILCFVCITERSFVGAVKRHSDVAYQHAREDMERYREIHAERQEERRKLKEEQRVRGVNLSSTNLSSSDRNTYGVAEDSDYDYGEDSGYEEYDSDGCAPEQEERSAKPADTPVEQDAGQETHLNRNGGMESVPEPAVTMEPIPEKNVDKADIFTGSISMPDSSMPDIPQTEEVDSTKQEVPFDTEDDYDFEAAARRLTREGFGRFEQVSGVFTGGARRVDQKAETGTQNKAVPYREEKPQPPQEQNSSYAASEPHIADAAPWEAFGVTEQEAGRESAYGQNLVRKPVWREPEPEAGRKPVWREPAAQEERKPVWRENAAQEERKPVWREASVQEEEKPAWKETLAAEEETSVWQEAEPEEYLPEPAVAYTVKTEQNTDFAIPEETKRVVTASGKVIETDTEALQKRFESTKQAEAAKTEAQQEESVEQQIKEQQEEPKKAYIFPPLNLLKRGSRPSGGFSEQEYRETAVKLQQTLRNFGVGVTVTNISCGPSVTRYELHPEQGVKVSKIVALADDIKLSLAAEDIRIEAPIPGKSAVGIEVPNKEKTAVFLRDLLESDTFQNHPSKLAFAVGKDIGGQVVVTDIAKMPHLLIAGATGSGKSVCINTIIMSIIYKADPEDVKLIMVDPKVVELSVYNGIPHLLIPVVTDPKKASGALNWAVAEMTDRYKKFAQYGVRDLKGYNTKVESIQDIEDEKKPKKMPQIVIIVDELADLMMVAPGEVEDAICRLAQLARAAGIHLVIATQRPSVNVITGLIKANVPSRIAFSVSSGVDSRTIIDMNGAEKLLGKGDMLFYPAGFPKPQRVQGAFVSDTEVQQVVDFLTEQGLTAQYSVEVENSMNAAPSAQNSGSSNSRDEYFEQAGRFIIEKEKASIGMLQRMFKIGFNRAARIMDQLAEAGVVGEEEGTKPRKVLMTMEEFDQII